jgi:hypothetical protein
MPSYPFNFAAFDAKERSSQFLELSPQLLFQEGTERPKMPIRSREHLGSGRRELHVGSALMPQQPAFEIARASAARNWSGLPP